MDPRYPEDFFRALPEFDRPETAVLPLPRLYLQAKQLAQDLASTERDGEVGGRGERGGRGGCGKIYGEMVEIL